MNLHIEHLKASIGPGLDRRVRWFKRWVWDFWDDYNEVVGLTLWSFVGLLICAGLWWVYGTWPRH